MFQYINGYFIWATTILTGIPIAGYLHHNTPSQWFMFSQPSIFSLNTVQFSLKFNRKLEQYFWPMQNNNTI